MRTLGLSAAVAVVGWAVLAADRPKSEAIVLFDGQSAANWLVNTTGKPMPDSCVQDGSINPRRCGGGLVYFKDPFANFKFACDFKMSEKCNSGVFFRVGDPKDEVNTGFEIQVYDTAHETTLKKNSCGALYDFVAPSKNVVKKAGEWNRMEITADKNIVKVVLNGELIVECDLDKYTEAGKNIDGTKNKFKTAAKDFPRKGYIGFQEHGHDCWFKNVTLQPLP